MWLVDEIGNNSANVLHKSFPAIAEKTLVLNVSVLSCSDFIRDADFCTEFSCDSGENSCVEVVSAFSAFAGAKRFWDCLKSETTRRAFCTEFSCNSGENSVLNVSVFELF